MESVVLKFLPSRSIDRYRSGNLSSSALGFCTAAFSSYFAQHWKPEAVCFTHAAPAKRDVHRKFFGTEVRFSQDFNGIICASADLDAPVPAADSKMVRHVKQYLDTLTSRRNTTMSATVRECIYTMLPSGLCSADSVAARLGIDRRTVHRHLQREGTTFSALIELGANRTCNAPRRKSRSSARIRCGAAWVFRPQRLLAMVSRSVWLQRVGVAREPRGASGLTRARARSVIARKPPRLDHSVKCKAAIDRIAIWSNILDLQGDDVASARLTVDGQVEHGQVTGSALESSRVRIDQTCFRS